MKKLFNQWLKIFTVVTGVLAFIFTAFIIMVIPFHFLHSYDAIIAVPIAFLWWAATIPMHLVAFIRFHSYLDKNL